MGKIIWTDQSKKDLHEIHRYISQDHPKEAQKFINKLYSSAQKLIRFPKLGNILYEYKKQGLRKLVVKSYLIIYREKNDDIEILTVHHSSRILKIEGIKDSDTG